MAASDMAAQNSKNEFPPPEVNLALQSLPDQCSPDKRLPVKPMKHKYLQDPYLPDHNASNDELVESVVEYALGEIEVEYQEDFSTLDESKKSELAQIARETAKEQVYLNAIPNIEDPNELARHLPAERINVIQKGLEFPTFELKLNRVDRHTYVDFTRQGRPIDMERIEIRSEDGIETRLGDGINWAKVYQYSSIAVEGVYLILSIGGNAFSVEDKDIKEVTEKTNEAIKESKMLVTEIEQLKEVWDDEDSGLTDKAAAIFSIIRALRKEHILWKIVKHLVKCVSIFEWLKLFIKAIAVVLSAIVTSGSSLISEIISAAKAALRAGR